MPIDLPEKPNNHQYEEFISSCLNALGYYIETRIEFRPDSTQVLELDVVATPSDDSFLDRMLIEAKSGDWGFSDLFKIYGWMSYLGIKKGCIIHLRELKEKENIIFDKIGNEINVNHFQLSTDDENLSSLPPPCNHLEPKVRKKLSEIIWFQQIAQRLAYNAFIHYCKSSEKTALIKKARSYQSMVQQSFFEKSPLRRAYALYSAFQDSPNLTGEFVDELSKEKKTKSINLWDKLNDTHDLIWLQYIMLLENKARIEIIKNALEHELGDYDTEYKIKVKNITISFGNLLDMMPSNFKLGFNKLKNHQYARRIPYLFQIFMEVLGGFYLIDNDRDFELLSTISGIPKDMIVDSLILMNDFFYFDRGWFYTQKNVLTCMKMIPGFIRGAGCFLRQTIYEIKEYNEICAEMSWLLGKWHNSLYYVLEKELKV